MTSDLRPYPEYKDSGLPWLGRVPAHWDVRRAKYLMREVDMRSAGEDSTLLSVSQYTGVTKRRSREGSDDPDTRASSLVGYKVTVAGDLIVNIMLAWNGSLGIAPLYGVVSPAYCVYRFHQGDPWFFHHLLRSPAYKAEIRRRSRGVVDSRLRLYTDDLFCMPLLLPNATEQQTIVRFVRELERRTNRFIRNRRRVVEVLNEQKQAIINRAVTRGLDPNAPLNPSGLDWLGNIPEHWKVVQLRRRWRVTDCKHVTVPFSDDGIPLASVREVQSFDLNLANCKRTTREWYEALIEGDRAPKSGDIIYCRNVSVGACACVSSQDELAMGQDVCLIRSHGENLRFLNYYLHSGAMQQQLVKVLVGSTFNRINVSEIKSLLVVLPPRSEQDSIAEYLDSEIESFDRPLEVAQHEIDLIREYRTRLIADVVTGKVDVRQASAAVAEKKTKRPANIHFRRSVFAAEIVHRLHDEPTFGHVKFEKLIFLCEKRCGVDTGSTYYRQAAGPYDNRALRSIDSQLRRHQWYEVQKHDKGYRYVPLERAGDHKPYFARYFGNVAARFDEIIDTFRTLSTERCEIIATLYAAWEDLLARGNVSDDQIIDQVLHHWHPSKQRIDEDRWRQGLGWIKAKGLSPEKGVTSANN